MRNSGEEGETAREQKYLRIYASAIEMNALGQEITFHCLACRDRLANRPLSDHDDRHFRKYPLRLDANAYAMNDVMSGLHATYGRVRGYDVYGVRMNAANAADAFDADLG